MLDGNVSKGREAVDKEEEEEEEEEVFVHIGNSRGDGVCMSIL